MQQSRAAQQMAGMAKSLERDPQLESVLSGRDRRDLGLEASERMGRSLSSALADSIPHDLGREISRGLGMSR